VSFGGETGKPWRVGKAEAGGETNAFMAERVTLWAVFTHCTIK
jgi:hypothetical protein